jgi:cobalt-zinc-cadmium efflux system membrane fusion protein
MKVRIAFLLLATMLLGCSTEEQEPPGSAEHHEHAEDAKGGSDHGHDEQGKDGIELPASQIEAAGIGLAVAEPGSIREVLSLYGVVAPNAERVRDVAARFPGLIRSVNKKVGDAARQGETLATVESNESLQTYPVTAPQAGVVTARNANPGEQTGDKVLFVVSDLSTVWVELSLFPRDVARVRVGQTVRVSSTDAALDGEGRIVYIAPVGSTASQTLAARVLLDNSDRRWAPGLYVNANVTLGETQAPLTVRSEAVQTVAGKTVVFLRNEHGFKPQPVTLGRTDGERSEVLNGLSAGQQYATTNSFVLKSELGKGEAGHDH